MAGDVVRAKGAADAIEATPAQRRHLHRGHIEGAAYKKSSHPPDPAGQTSLPSPTFRSKHFQRFRWGGSWGDSRYRGGSPMSAKPPRAGQTSPPNPLALLDLGRVGRLGRS